MHRIASQSTDSLAILTADDLVKIWKIPRWRVYRLVRDQAIPHFRMSKLVRFRRQALIDFMESGGARLPNK